MKFPILCPVKQNCRTSFLNQLFRECRSTVKLHWTKGLMWILACGHSVSTAVTMNQEPLIYLAKHTVSHELDFIPQEQ